MSKGFADAREMWDHRYAQEGYLFGKAPNTWLASKQDYLQPGMKVLAVADGEGRNSVWLAQQGLQVDAFDLSAVGVDKARKLAREVGVTVHYEVADVDQRTWSANTYDAVVAIFIQFADPDMRARLFQNMAHTVRPGGLILLHGYTPKQIDYATGGPGRIEHLYTPDMLRAAYANFELLELNAFEAVLQEGDKHAGLSALIGMVARKPAE